MALLLEVMELVDFVGHVVASAVAIVGCWLSGNWFLTAVSLVFVLVSVLDNLLHDVWWMSN